MTKEPTHAPRVLVVEDYPDTRVMYAAYLRHCGYEVIEAEDGPSAMRMASATTPDVIVMDMALPGLDGWEVTRRLKSNPATRHVPVVALTGHGLEDYERHARDVGCIGFLVKPCLPDVLAAEIDRVLAQRGSEQA